MVKRRRANRSADGLELTALPAPRLRHLDNACGPCVADTWWIQARTRHDAQRTTIQHAAATVFRRRQKAVPSASHEARGHRYDGAASSLLYRCRRYFYLYPSLQAGTKSTSGGRKKGRRGGSRLEL